MAVAVRVTLSSVRRILTKAGERCERNNMVNETVSLPEHQAEFVRTLIASGRFASINEVVRAGVNVLEELIEEEEKRREELRVLLDEAVASGISERTPREIFEAALAKYKADNA